MRILRTLLAVAALTLPAAHRARWREEALAVLADVPGARRWWYALDTVLKVPLLAHQFRTPVAPPRRWLSALTGAALIGTSVLLVAAVLAPPLIGEGAAEFLFLLAPCGLLGVVAVRSFWTAKSYGGGLLPYLIAAFLTVFAGTGPVAAGALSVATDTAAVAMIGAVIPGLWLILISGAALLRHTSPPALAVTGMLCGAGLLAALIGLQLVTHVPALRGPGSALTAMSVMLLVPAWPVWSLWTGVRLIRADTPHRLI
ncbi:hypothetical protein [Actinoplanes sp. DH11]|uniref:hypothetical protein n=1 Tax=Actinoplanes sp. DH11 TaxID=2857011 RepID=UPI001E62A172|nr:hypothetical protein [Actinoplanes sp. DH11]